MRTPMLALVLLTALPAMGGERVCLDPGKTDHYSIKIVGDKSFVLGDASDATQPSLAVVTSCLGLKPTDKIALPGSANCVSVESTIQATPAGGRPQACQVIKVMRTGH